MMYEEVSESETEGESASETESVTHSEQLVDNSEKVTDQTQELLNESEEEPAKESREEIHERQAEEIPEQIRNEQRNEYLPQCPEFDYDKDVKRIRKEERENMAKEQEMRKKQGGTNSTLLPFSSDEMGLLRCGPPGGWTVSNPPLQPSKPLKQPFAEYNANYAPYSKPNKSRLKATNPKSDDNSSSGPSLHHRTPVLKPKITHNLLHELGKVLHEKLIACNTGEDKNAALLSILETSGFAQIFAETDQQKSAKKKITKTERNSAQLKYLSFDNKHYWANFVKDEGFSQEVRKSFFCKMAEFQQKKNAPHRRRNPEEIVLAELPNLMDPEDAASQSASPSVQASRKNTHIQREPTTRTREPTRRYPEKDFYLPPKGKKKNETWCNCGVRGDDHLPAVQCDGCGTWYHYEKNGEGMQHCDYTEGQETEEWYCMTCREENQISGEFDSIQPDDDHDNDKDHHPDNMHDNADGGFENLTHTECEDPSLTQIRSSDNSEANLTRTSLLEMTEPEIDHESDRETVIAPMRAKETRTLENVQLDMDTICSVLNVTEEELNYIPPKEIDIIFSAESISKIYNYDTGKFVQEKKARGDELAQRLRESGILCAFKNSRAPYYYATKKQNQSFAKQEGYCTCGMKFNLIFLCKPVQGFPVKAKCESSGVFNLVQSKRTSRPITGDEREKLAKTLLTTSAVKVFLTDMSHVAGLELLHRNVPPTTDVLRTTRAEGKAKERFDSNVFEDLKKLDQHYKLTHNPDGVIKGYMQDYNLDPKLFRVDLFDQQSLKLLADKIAKEHVTLGIDATGGIFKPLPNAGGALDSSSQPNSKNQPRSARPRNSLLLYSFVAQTGSGNFVVADSILMRGQSNDIGGPLTSVKRGLKKLRPYQPKSAPDIICTDFNFAMLHAVSESFNVMKLDEYLKRSYDVLQDKATFSGDIACIQLCASHLTKSFLDNVRRKTATSKHAKKLVDASVRGLAKFQECTCLDEVNIAMQDVCTLFGMERMTSEEINNTVGRISSMALDGCVEPDDGNSPNFEEEDEVATKLLREKSPYYHLFRKIRKNLVQDVEVDAASNPYYSPSVLNIYENTYVPFIGIFARGVVQKTKYPNFVRVTNGGTESEFRLIKNNLIANPENVADFIRNRFTITNGKNKRFVLENLPKSKTRKEPPTSSANLQNDVTCYAEERNAEFSQQEVEECAETWNKRGKRGRTNKYMHNRRDIRLKDLQRGKSDAEGRTLQPTQTISPIAGSEVTQFPDTTVFFRTESFPPIPKKEFHHFFHSDRKLSDTIINGRLHKLMDDAEGEQKKIFVSHSGTMYHHPELFFGGRSVEAAGWQSTMATLEDLSSVHTPIMHPLRHGDHWLLTTVEIKTRTLQLYDPLDHDNNYLKNITDNLTHFFDEVFTQKRVGEPQTKKHWTVEFPGCPKQRDSSSCGIYIIKYAFQYYQAFPHIKQIEINQNETEDQLRMDIAQEMINSEEGKPFLAKFGEDAELFIKNLKLQDPNIIKSLQSNPQLLNLSGDEITTSNLERKFRKIVEDVLTDQHGNLEKQKTRVKTLGKDHVAKEKDKYKRYKLIEALSEESIMKAYHEIKLDVLQIYVPKPETFSGEYKCPRQKIWVERKPNFCANLQQMVVSYPFSAKSFQIISTQLSSDLRKAENMETLAFNDILQVSNVLVPEAFERIYSKIMQMPLEHAQRELENNFPT
ncbi:Transcription factor 19 [Folsomia candida]|uniref:Transcription factor 19 n=1 Tax=Folsomia candida TaxID=158441 RepID=A0A226F2F7_FOLCA|nr:Transcription factor 19 [Folsomia candida]